MRGFAVALFVGMIAGTYSTIFIASGFVLWWENRFGTRKPSQSTKESGRVPHAPPKASPATR